MLKYATFTSDIELSFYASLASHKINHDKLDDSAKRLLGVYEVRPTENPANSGRMQLHGNALTADDVPASSYRAEGYIKNFNTIEEYRESDKTAILDKAARTIWEAINDGTIYSCPSLLSSFTALCFADLKKYKFTYLFGYPALHSEPSWTIVDAPKQAPDYVAQRSDAKKNHFSADESTALVEAVQTWRYSVDARQWGFFLAKKIPRSHDDEEPTTPGATTPGDSLDFNWQIGSLGEYEKDFFKGVPEQDQFVSFADPSTYEDHPGWPLRNLLALVRNRWKINNLQVLSYRDVQARRHEARSRIFNIKCDAPAGSALTEMPKVTGWERGPSGKVTSKIANLGAYMDPAKLADQAVDLNLKLIKWRIAPKLDLDVIKNTKCLLLGAGTLGSYVSRNLLGWGVKKVTFVDNGTVSYSNPVRQPLFNFADCADGGAKKAERAAAALKEIYPGVDSQGFSMSVPMAGHPLVDEAKTHEEYNKLHQLFVEHDVIFLLMDTRESRWLPTVMGKAMGKLVLNAALGFDSFVVLRHGVTNMAEPEKELGCYFCNDVVAPADSMSDRTLDQQCTVTRPGIAAIASASLVEIMVSVLQHKDGYKADTEPDPDHPLGEVPHTIRGFLSNWNNMKIRGPSYSQCSACSNKVLQAYRGDGWEFVKKALNDKDYVSELSGLAELQRQAEKASADVDWEEEDEEGEGDKMGDDGEML